jgi:tripartite-type tricarboxylate transporter receptor subunit TctC
LSEANPTANLGSKWLLAMMSPNLLVEERRGRDGYRFAQPILRDEFSGSFCRLIRCGIVAALAAAVTTQPARSAGVEDFYKGKTVSLLIGYSVGGGYDAYGRLLARHLGKHIPGSPSVVPQNMTGAGSLKAANYVYSVAPKDGSVIGTFSRSMGIAPLLDKAEFDSTKFTWLGSVTDEVSLCVTRHDAPVKSFSELLVAPATFGAEGAGSDPNIFASFYRNVLGAKIKVVTGYPGTNEIQLAVERGEVDGLCGLSWSTLKGRYPHWLKEKRANIMVQAGIKKQPELPDVPSASDLAKATDQTQILRLLLIGQAMARPFAAPPGIPADRRAALIAAFERTTADPDFLAEGERLNFEVNPVSANQLDALLAEAYATPKDVIAKAAKAMSE